MRKLWGFCHSGTHPSAPWSVPACVNNEVDKRSSQDSQQAHIARGTSKLQQQCGFHPNQLYLATAIQGRNRHAPEDGASREEEARAEPLLGVFAGHRQLDCRLSRA
jgi:hypothetical protein